MGLGNLGMVELGIIASIALLIFGPRQLPRLGRSLGQSIREFRGAGKALTESLEAGLNDDATEGEGPHR